MDHCTKCGTLVKPGDAFCPACGAKRAGVDDPARPEHPFRPIVLSCLGWAVVTWLIYANLAHHNWVALIGTAIVSFLIVGVAVGSWTLGHNVNKAAEKINTGR